MLTKKQIRLQIIGQMTKLSADERRTAGERVAGRLYKLIDPAPGGVATPSPVSIQGSTHPLLSRARVLFVGIFESFKDEIDTKPIIEMLQQAGIKVLFPSWDNEGMRFFPSSQGERELYIVPGLAFDGNFNRLGRGRGYYDKFIQKARRKSNPPIFIGICLDCQLIDQVPVEKHDQKVDILLTPSRMICS